MTKEQAHVSIKSLLFPCVCLSGLGSHWFLVLFLSQDEQECCAALHHLHSYFVCVNAIVGQIVACLQKVQRPLTTKCSTLITISPDTHLLAVKHKFKPLDVFFSPPIILMYYIIVKTQCEKTLSFKLLA